MARHPEHLWILERTVRWPEGRITLTKSFPMPFPPMIGWRIEGEPHADAYSDRIIGVQVRRDAGRPGVSLVVIVDDCIAADGADARTLIALHENECGWQLKHRLPAP
jgi:hypothetical protein